MCQGQPGSPDLRMYPPSISLGAPGLVRHGGGHGKMQLTSKNGEVGTQICWVRAGSGPGSPAAGAIDLAEMAGHEAYLFSFESVLSTLVIGDLWNRKEFIKVLEFTALH